MGKPKGENPERTPAEEILDLPAGEEPAAGEDASGESEKPKILGRFKDQKALEDSYQKLEAEHNRKSQRLQQAETLFTKLEGISDMVVENPLTGQIELKPELKEKLGKGEAGGRESVREALRESLKVKFNQKSEKDPTEAIVDTILEAAEVLSNEAAGRVERSVRADLGTMATMTEMDRYLTENPEDEVISQHVQAWINSKPTSLRKSIAIDEAFTVVREKLRKSGALEDLGYKAGSGRRGRPGQSLGNGDPGNRIEPKPPDTAAEDKKILEEIRGGESAMEKFLKRSAKNVMGINPFR
jgi:hypothetical protein